MTAHPSTIAPDARLQDASAIDGRPAVANFRAAGGGSSNGICLGLLRLHDIYRAGSL